MHKFEQDISSYPYISSYTFRLLADHGWMSDNDLSLSKGNLRKLKNGINPESVKPGDIIYVVTEYLDRYFDEVHYKLTSPVVLVTGRCDRGIEHSDLRRVDDNIIHWFSTNVNVEHDKISSIPLGLQNKHWRIKNHPQSDITLLDEVNNTNVMLFGDVLMSFQIHTNPTHRKEVWKYFEKQDFVTIRNYSDQNRTDRTFVRDYFKEIKGHKFVVCPRGGGYDCHRIWEVWSLGSFPIIKKHKSMEAFYDMPAWFVDDWKEVNSKTICDKYDVMSESLRFSEFNTDKILFDHWASKITSMSHSWKYK